MDLMKALKLSTVVEQSQLVDQVGLQAKVQGIEMAGGRRQQNPKSKALHAVDGDEDRWDNKLIEDMNDLPDAQGSDGLKHALEHRLSNRVERRWSQRLGRIG